MTEPNEPLLIRDDITVKVDGGVLPLPWTPCTGNSMC